MNLKLYFITYQITKLGPPLKLGFVFEFKTGTDVLILIEDSFLSVQRPQTLNRFGISGERIHLKKQNNSLFRYFAVQFHQNLFIEADPARRCLNYPNIYL